MNTQLDWNTIKSLEDALEDAAFGPSYNLRRSSRRGLALGMHMPRAERVVTVQVIALVVSEPMIPDGSADALAEQIAPFAKRHRVTLVAYTAGERLCEVPVRDDGPEWPPVSSPTPLDPKTISSALRKRHPNVYNCKPLAVFAGGEEIRDIQFGGALVRCIGPIRRDDDDSPHSLKNFNVYRNPI